MSAMVPSTSFVCRRVNNSTFMIIEDDAYGEQPHIYVKVYPQHLLITDTGCNTPRQKDIAITSLCQYLEVYPISCNNHQILNPGGKKPYIIICSHCHYDHILGISSFISSNPTIIASSFGKSFILEDLPTNSLCKYIGVPTPQYKVSYWAENLSHFSQQPEGPLQLRIQFLNIPGHTPCSLAWYDIDEHHLYIGDTFYERKRAVPILELPAMQAAIIFPEEGGSFIQYIESLNFLLSFTKHRNTELKRQRDIVGGGEAKRVLVACGHMTFAGDAEDMITEVKALFWRIIDGKVPVNRSGKSRGVIYDFWIEDDDSRYSVRAPRHLAEDAKKYFGR